MENQLSKSPNYSEAEASRLVELYNEHGNSKEAVTFMTATLNAEFDTDRSERSILGKLINMVDEDGNPIYTKRAVLPKVAKDMGPTKKELLTKLEGIVGEGFNATPLQGATKVGIESVIEVVEQLQAVNS